MEYLPADVKEIKDVTDALEQNIRPESSDVVAGKILALRIKDNDFTKFTEEAEKLAEAFRRSLVVEGISGAKAQEMTIKKTVELCRKSTKSEVTKSVIAAATYSQPADVLAKFVTETDIARREKREADATKMYRQQNPNFNRGGKNGRFNGRGNSRGNFNNFGNGNGRGNGRFQGNRQQNDNRSNFRGNSNGRGYMQNRNFQNRSNRPNEHTIRVVTGNGLGPSPGQMAPQQFFQPQQNQQNDQIFQIPFQ